VAGMGPPPKPANARARRNATVAMTVLPMQGRGKRNAPPWPLIPDIVTTVRRDLAAAKVLKLEDDLADASPSERPGIEARLDRARERLAIHEAQLAHQRRLEAVLWRDLWRLPQAVAWERLEWTRDVAQYVRHKVLGELGELADAKEARQWSDRLGLSPMSMLRLRWTVAKDEVAEKRAEREQRDADAAAAKAVPAADPYAALRAE